MAVPVMKIDTNVSASVVRRTKVDLVCLVDADFLKYITVHNIFKWIEKNDTDPIDVYGLDYLKHFVDEALDNWILKKIDAKAFIFLFSGSSKKTFRYQIGFEKEYKGNRKVTDDYMYDRKFEDMAGVIHVIAERYVTYIHANLEADDLAGVLQRKGTFIFSTDKDLKQLPGQHWDVKLNKLVEISQEQALMQLCYQLLAGDVTDNIPGFRGMGDKRTMDFLNEVGNVKQMPIAIMKHYITSFGITKGIDMFTETWMLVKLRMERGAHFTGLLATEIETINEIIKK